MACWAGVPLLECRCVFLPFCVLVSALPVFAIFACRHKRKSWDKWYTKENQHLISQEALVRGIISLTLPTGCNGEALC